MPRREPASSRRRPISHMARLHALIVITALSASAADLPVRKVTLYKHGVGYFERGGELKPGEAARLDFQASEMNDVLKSLTLEDKSGAKVTGLRYDASDPLSRKLSRFPFQLQPGQPFTTLLDQLKGARMEAKFGPEVLSGSIVSARVTPAVENHPEEQQATLLLDSGEFRTVNLLAASSIRFLDSELQKQFKEYLEDLSQSRSREKRSVYINSTESGTRQIIAGYVIPTPVWKSSYRLILRDSAASTLEGWAIVDNTSGEDWSNIKLALVSGRPISFVSALYEPRYLIRPQAQLAEDNSVPPEVYEGAVREEAEKGGVVGGVPGGTAGGVIGGIIAPAPMAAPAPPPPPHMKAATEAVTVEQFAKLQRGDVASSIQQQGTVARELGELFEYDFSSPVTVNKGESAMLPFLQQAVESRKLLIYSDQSTPNPRSAVEITNNTAKTLDGGPITVYDAGAYAGEALVETVKAGDKRLISYAVDLGTRITTKFDSRTDNVREVHFRQGILMTKSAQIETRTYTIRNVEKKPKTLIIEHPVRPQYKLTSQKPVETTSSAYRFEVKLGAASTETLPVTEENLYENSIAVANVTPDLLLSYTQNKTLSDSARKQLEQIARLKQQVVEADRRINQRATERNELAQDQGRLRQNIESLNRVPGQQDQVQNYARQLSELELKLVTLRDQESQDRKQRATLQEQLDKAINTIEF